MTDRLDVLERRGGMPFDLDFLRAMGWRFGLDWDGELEVEEPLAVNVAEMTDLIHRFDRGITKRLEFEGRRAREICVGGPCNGRAVPVFRFYGDPVYFHLGRAKWAVYHIRSRADGRAWFVGEARSKAKARRLWLIASKPSSGFGSGKGKRC
jgi:hypothetical protein